MDIITGKILKLNGWPDGRVIGLAKDAAAGLLAQGLDRDSILARLGAVRQNPGSFLADASLADLARECIRITQTDEVPDEELRAQPLAYPTWGRENIEDEAAAQMDNAMRLPITIAGALMPDAHVGYGLPIGGVLATDNAVIPYAVGVDIACRMRLSIYEVSPYLLGQKKGMFEDALLEQTAFGMGAQWKGNRRADHAVLDDSAWDATCLLQSLHDNAAKQLGTSGTGNHFVEWGSFRLHEPLFGLQPGEYLALLSHSGSRGVGFKIADRYSKLAMEKHPDLDKSVRHLAWLSLDSEEGQEYWLSMELAGRFASANHTIIHHRVAQAVGLKEAAVVENHHNFAWKEQLADGRTVIVHRKGATPAGVGVLGMIRLDGRRGLPRTRPGSGRIAHFRLARRGTINEPQGRAELHQQVDAGRVSQGARRHPARRRHGRVPASLQTD
jgi:tRNA-splicing ligase RtcB